MNEEKKFTTNEICERLNVKPYDINNLFTSGRLKRADFPLTAGIRFYSQSDIEKIKEALSDVAYYQR